MVIRAAGGLNATMLNDKLDENRTLKGALLTEFNYNNCKAPGTVLEGVACEQYKRYLPKGVHKTNIISKISNPLLEVLNFTIKGFFGC